MFKKDQPSWFLPKPLTNYDVWIWEIDSCTFEGIFEDKEFGEFGRVFLTAAQL
jgi:hypothetical protein